MSEAEHDLDIAIGHYAELLASNIHAQRAAHFPPDAKKVMRSLTSGEAAELLGVDHTYLRKLHREGKISDVETTAGSHRRYTLDDVWEIRHALEANAKKPGTYVPGRRAGDELQVVSVVNFKGGSGKTTMCGHLAVQAELAGCGPVALIDTDPIAIPPENATSITDATCLSANSTFLASGMNCTERIAAIVQKKLIASTV